MLMALFAADVATIVVWVSCWLVGWLVGVVVGWLTAMTGWLGGGHDIG